MGVTFLKKQNIIMMKIFFLLSVFICLTHMCIAQEDEEQSDNLFKKAGRLWKNNKSKLFSLVGLEEGKEEQFLGDILKNMNFDTTTITNITSSFNDQREGVKELVQALKDPAQLPQLLGSKTNMDQASIDGFVQQVKGFIGSGAVSFQSFNLVLILICSAVMQMN